MLFMLTLLGAALAVAESSPSCGAGLVAGAGLLWVASRQDAQRAAGGAGYALSALCLVGIDVGIV